MPRSLKTSNADTAAGVRLPEVLAIGFTGHRKLPDEAKCRARIHSFLAEQQAAGTHLVCGVSSVAAGADLLFAESCLALGIPLRVLLPLNREEFRKDFDETSWARAEMAMRGAVSVETIGSDAFRDERYYECGLETVQQSQMLLALWNGERAMGLGGTEEIVEFAKQMGRPVTWMHSETGDIQTYNERSLPAHHRDAELGFLNRLSAAGVACVPGSPTETAAAWLEKLDHNAVQVAPQVRRLAAFPIVCTALAAFLSASATRMHATGWRSTSVWLGAGAALGLLASVLPAALRLGKRQALWVRIRTAAEVTRSVFALWHMPARYQVVGPEILPELGGMLRALNLLQSQAERTDTMGVDTFKAEYLEARLIDQRRYFLRQAAKASGMARRYRLAGKLCTIGAIAMSVWMFAGHSVFKLNEGWVGGEWLPLLASALFQVATVTGALVVVNDCDRRQRRYREIHDSLAVWETELRALRTWPPVIQVVGRIERALLVELIEWRSLLQNMKMPRN